MKKYTIKLIEPSCVSQQPPARARRQSVAAARRQAHRRGAHRGTQLRRQARAAHTSLASQALRAASASMMIMEAVLENWAWNRRTTIVCVCAHLFVLLHDLSNVSFYNLSHAFTRQPPKTKHVLPIENKSKGIC